jgi:hypothetical protein
LSSKSPPADNMADTEQRETNGDRMHEKLRRARYCHVCFPPTPATKTDPQQLPLGLKRLERSKWFHGLTMSAHFTAHPELVEGWNDWNDFFYKFGNFIQRI